MTTTKQRKGFALGAAFAMVASLFSALPAQAADAVEGANIAVRPASGPSANFNGLLDLDFAVYAQLNVGETNTNWATTSALTQIVWEVTETSGLYDIIAVSSNTEAGAAAGATFSTTSRAAAGVDNDVSISATFNTETTPIKVAATDNDSGLGTVSVSALLDATSKKAFLSLRAVSGSSITSESGNATVTVKVWIDEAPKNGILDAEEWYTEETVTLHAQSRVPVSTTVAGIEEASTTLTISSTIGGLNFDNLGGKYFVVADSQGTIGYSKSSAITPAKVEERGGIVSASFAIGADGLVETNHISVSAMFDPSGDGTTNSSWVLGAWYGETVASGAASAVSLRMDNEEVNVTGSASTKKVRLNQEYTVLVGATTASGATSVSGVATSVAFSGVSLAQFSKEIRVNGGAWTSSLPAAVSVTTGADGWGSFTYETRGFVDGDDLTLTVTKGQRTGTLTVESEAPSYKVHNDYHYYQTGAGQSVDVTYSVRDQWNVLSTKAHKLVITRGGTGFSYATTVSEVVTTNGTFTFAFTPQAATTTGSATLAAVGYIMDTNGSYITTGVTSDGNITVNVSDVSNAFTTGLAGSYSSSISYFPSTLSWATVTANAANTGSAVTVTGTGVIFKDAAGNTSSGTMTVRVGSDQGYTFYATSTMAGTYTMTLTNGTATTTSQLIVSEPGSDQGVAINWDTSAIDAGKTKIVTGTLVDANGNPVYTDNVGSVDVDKTTASILVTYAGSAGIPVGTMPTETDADGKFKVSILTSAADQGTFTLTAVYSKDGSVTATADKLTSVQTITVGTAAASAADQKVNAGSFKGYVAVYAKGYEGQRLSAKVGNDWVVVPSLASNFERVVEFTGAGYTIAVRIYIDRVLVDTITVTTK